MLELNVIKKEARFQNCVNYHGQLENNLFHGHGTGTFSDGSTYEGDWFEGLPHGRGVWKNGKETFEGDFLRGQFHGRGKHTLADGSVYEGDFQNDLRHGHGVLTNSESSVFDCEWFEGKKHGKGSEKLANGETFVGHYENDHKLNGLRTVFSGTNCVASFEGSFCVVSLSGKSVAIAHVGKLTQADGVSVEGDFQKIATSLFTVCWPNGDNYVGQTCHFDLGTPHGFGTKILKDKTVLTGKWHQGRLEHKRAWWQWALLIAWIILLILSSIYGLSSTSVSRTNTTITYPDGGVYVGSLVNGTVRHGEGHMSYAGGDTYNGSWVNGQRAGRGCSQSADQKTVYEGHWVNDTCHGDGVMRFANGYVYNGTFHLGKMHGHGVYKNNSTADEYSGGFQNDTRHGHGVMRFANGDVFNGTYHLGKMRKGFMRFSNNDSYNGTYYGNVIHGSGVYTYNRNTSIVGTVVYKGEWFNGSMVNRGQFDYLDGWYTVYGEWYEKTAEDIIWGKKVKSMEWRTTCIGIGSNIVIPVHGQWVGIHVMTAYFIFAIVVILFCVIFGNDPHTSTSERRSAATSQPTPSPSNSVDIEKTQQQPTITSVAQIPSNTAFDIPTVLDTETVSNESQHQCPDCKRIISSDLPNYAIHVKICALQQRQKRLWQLQKQQQ